jgi:hypothetical protein
MNFAVRPRRSGLLTLASAAVLLLLCGCSSFNREWKRAARVPVPPDSVAGRWEGQWLSAANGHNGKLRCLITEQTNGMHEARFHATYLKVMTFGYTVPLDVTRTNQVWYFHGEADLGKLAGGLYRYEGMSTVTNFSSTYCSKHDHGTFEMSRPAE